jgi:hypothetical protein
MLQTLYNIKQGLSNHLIDDVIKIIQFNYYVLTKSYFSIMDDILEILNKYYKYEKISYEKTDNRYFKTYLHDSYGYYITIEYDKISSDPANKKEKDIYGVIIKKSKYFKESTFKSLESRLIKNTCFKKIKSKKNCIKLYK